MSNDLKSIEKWLCIDHEITLLTKANGYLLIQDEYADFYLVRPDFTGNDHQVTKIELNGQPSVSLLQNVSYGDAKEVDDEIVYEVSYDYFLPAKVQFVEVRGDTSKIYDLSFLNKG